MPDLTTIRGTMLQARAAKAAASNRVLVATGDPDRNGRRVRAFTTENFAANPVLRYGHDASRLPIGSVSDVVQTNAGTPEMRLEATIHIDRSQRFAAAVADLWDRGLLRMVSYGAQAPMDADAQDVFGADIWESIRGWVGIGDFPMPGEGGIFVMVGVGILLAIIGWIVWAVITWWIGGRIFKGTTDVGEMLRVLGFAQAPRVIGVIPFLGPVAAVWVLVASVVAIREGLDFSTGRAVGTAIGGWLVWFALQQLVEILIAAIF